MKTILESFEAFGERLSPDEPFSARDFMRIMEPVFAAGGYRTPRTAGEKIEMLVIMDAGVGDFLCFSGALREIRRLYPEAAITLMIFPPGFKLAEQCPYIDFLLIRALCERLPSRLHGRREGAHRSYRRFFGRRTFTRGLRRAFYAPFGKARASLAHG